MQITEEKVIYHQQSHQSLVKFRQKHFIPTFVKKLKKRAAKSNENVSYDNLMIITAVQWSDDFDPNSFCKNNRDQCGYRP